MISKARIESKVAKEEPGRRLVELTANEKTLVKVPIIKVLENIVDEFGNENARHLAVVYCRTKSYGREIFASVNIL
jgi:hypothetical protein